MVRTGQDRQNRRTWTLLAAVGTLVLVGLLIRRASTPAGPVAGPIIYTVTSTCDASITYTGAGGETIQQSGIHFGWSRQVDPGRTAHIAARTSCDAGQVEVTIERDGHVFKGAVGRGNAEASVTFR